MKLDESDVRQIVHLVGQAPAQSGGHAFAKRFLMKGLARMLGADAWVWGLSCQRDPEKPQMYVSFLKNGFTESTFSKFLQACEHPGMIEITAPYFLELKEKNTHLTRARQQIVDPAKIARTEAIALWKEANIGPVILSVRPLDAISASTIGLYRRFGRPEFTARESRIAHIVLSEVSWLHEQGWPEDRGIDVPTMSRRERLTLNLLTAGQSQKEIAAHMDISVHTVSDYVKAVYRRFGVKSQAQLMNRFYQGNGHDVTQGI